MAVRSIQPVPIAPEIPKTALPVVSSGQVLSLSAYALPPANTGQLHLTSTPANTEQVQLTSTPMKPVLPRPFLTQLTPVVGPVNIQLGSKGILQMEQVQTVQQTTKNLLTNRLFQTKKASYSIGARTGHVEDRYLGQDCRDSGVLKHTGESRGIDEGGPKPHSQLTLAGTSTQEVGQQDTRPAHSLQVLPLPLTRVENQYEPTGPTGRSNLEQGSSSSLCRLLTEPLNPGKAFISPRENVTLILL